MLFKLDLGAELDVATSDELENMGNSVVDRLKGQPKQEPRYFTVPFSGSSANSAATPFQLSQTSDSPPVNHCWEIFGVTVVGSDDHTAVPGDVALYYGNPANPTLMDLKIPLLTIPSYTAIGSRRLFVGQGQHLYLMVSGVANNQSVTALVHVSEERVPDKIATGLL